jgi:type IV secretion system protein TrbL
MISTADPVGITGGLPIAVLLMLCMVLGLLLVFLMLIVQLVTLYFTGVLLPLGLVWIIDPSKRQFGTKIVSVWIGILAAHPLLFFLLGFAFTIMANSVSTFGNNASLQSLVTLSVAVIALFVATLSPLLLLKFAPVIPASFGGTNGPALSTNSIGSRNMSDAGKRFDKTQTGARTNSAGGGSSGASEVAAGTAEQKTLAGVSAARAGSAGSAGAAGAAESAGGVAAVGATSATAAEGLAAAGAAESATGVGAAIGIPTLVIAAGAAAATQGLKLTEAAGKQATAAMDDSPIGADRTS